MKNYYISIEDGVPESTVLLVIFLLNDEGRPLPYRLAFFDGTKFAIIGGEHSSGTYIEKGYVKGYHYILNKEGMRVKAI